MKPQAVETMLKSAALTVIVVLTLGQLFTEVNADATQAGKQTEPPAMDIGALRVTMTTELPAAGSGQQPVLVVKAVNRGTRPIRQELSVELVGTSGMQNFASRSLPQPTKLWQGSCPVSVAGQATQEIRLPLTMTTTVPKGMKDSPLLHTFNGSIWLVKGKQRVGMVALSRYIVPQKDTSQQPTLAWRVTPTPPGAILSDMGFIVLPQTNQTQQQVATNR